MAKAGANSRHCALAGCGRPFTPSDVRQRYCTPTCSDTHLKQRRRVRTCRQCKALYTLSAFRRFCGYDCRTQYLEARRLNSRPVLEPIAVLLPLGSSPRRTISGAYVDGQLPERRVFCRRYERCLSYAESQRWAGFDCSGCDVDEAVMPYLTGRK